MGFVTDTIDSSDVRQAVNERMWYLDVAKMRQNVPCWTFADKQTRWCFFNDI